MVFPFEPILERIIASFASRSPHSYAQLGILVLQERWTKSHSHADNSSNGSPASAFLSFLMFSHVSHVSQFSFEDLFYLLVWITREYIGSCNNGSDWIMPGPSRWQIATIIPLFNVGFLKSAS